MSHGRYRSYDERLPSSIESHETRRPQDGGNLDQSFTVSTYGKSGSIDDDPHPGFKRNRNKGRVVLGNLAVRHEERRFTDAYLTYSVPSAEYTRVLTGDLASQVTGQVGLTSRLARDIGPIEMAIFTKAYAKVSDGSVMSGEIIADLADTIRMLRSPLGSSRKLLHRMCKDVKRRRFKRSSRSLSRAVADAWLEYRYGMKPLVLDINQTIDIANQLQARKRLSVFRSGGEAEESLSQSFSGVVVPWWFGQSGSTRLKASGIIRTERKYRMNAGVIVEHLPQTSLEQLASSLRLGVDAMPSTAWELVPFSFVADWFFNVGDWIAATNLPYNINVKGNWSTRVLDYREEMTSTDLEYSGWRATSAFEHGTWGSNTRIVKEINRSVNLAPPAHPVSVKRYSTLTHASDAAALALNPVLELIRNMRS